MWIVVPIKPIFQQQFFSLKIFSFFSQGGELFLIVFFCKFFVYCGKKKSRVRIIALCQNVNKTFGFDLERLPVLKPLCSAIRNRMQGQSRSPIRNTSLLLRLHSGTIHESNLEHLLVCKAPRGEDPIVQYGTTLCF